MASLIAAALVVLAIHFLVSGTRLRDGIVRAIGEAPYLGLFSLASLGTIVWLVMAFNAASASAENRFLYNLGPGLRDAGIIVIALAFILGIQGLLLPNPTSVRQEAAASKPGTVHGVLRITRHPFLWGVAIWAAFHTAANGTLAEVIFFGTFLVLAVLGTLSIDAKRRRTMGEAWQGFAEETSNIPFAAAILRRKPLNLGEDFGWRFWVAIAVFAAILLAHAPLFGVSPFPAGWRPF